MNNQTMRLAVAAGFLDGDLELFPETIERFAELVRQDEREACAKLCDELTESSSDHEAGAALNIRETIRARGEK